MGHDEHTGEEHDDRYYDKHCHPDNCDEFCEAYPCELCPGCACCVEENKACPSGRDMTAQARYERQEQRGT